MLKLLIDAKNFNGGSVPVSWCLDTDTLMRINESATKDKQPFIVIVAAPEESYHISKESRWVVPLKAAMTYLSFRYSGKNNIFGFGVWGANESEVKDKYCHISSYLQYSATVLSNDGQELLVNRHLARAIAETVTVEVPKECFAKEPPVWEKTWVNWLFKHKADDQCDFRKRRILAYFPLFQPLWFVFLMIPRLVVVTFGLLLGLKPINFRPWYRPLTHSFHDIVRQNETSVFWPSSKNRVRQALLRILLLPFCPVLVFSAGGIGIFNELGSVWWESAFLGFAWLYMIWIAMAIGFYVIVAIVAIIVPLGMAIPTHRFERKRVNWHEDDAEDMACHPGIQPLTLDRLPKRKRTIRLRFDDLKGRICKPFQG